MTDRRRWGISRLGIVVTQISMLTVLALDANRHNWVVTSWGIMVVMIFFLWPLAITIRAIVKG